MSFQSISIGSSDPFLKNFSISIHLGFSQELDLKVRLVFGVNLSFDAYGTGAVELARLKSNSLMKGNMHSLNMIS